MKVLLFEQHRPFFEQTATVFNRRKTATGRRCRNLFSRSVQRISFEWFSYREQLLSHCNQVHARGCFAIQFVCHIGQK